MSWQDYEQQVNSSGPFSGNTGRDVGIGLLGGPIGWYALASHDQNLINSTDFGNVWGNTTYNKSMTKDVYDSMSQSDWDVLKKMNESDQNNWIAARSQQVSQLNAQKGKSQAIIDQLQKFADEMNMPMDQLLQKDEFAKMLQGTTVAQSMAQSKGGGMGAGGFSQNAAQSAAQKALLGYQMQRQGAGNQALGQINDLQNQQYGMTLTNNALNAQSANNFLAGQAANRQGMESAIMSMFGGGAGMMGAAAARAAQGQGQQGIGGTPQYNPQPMPTSYYGSGGGYASGGPTYGTYNSQGGGVGYNYPSPVAPGGSSGGNY